MGYSTDFKGELKFATELTATQLGKVKGFCDGVITMDKLERAFVTVVLLCVAIAAIDWIGVELHALLAMFDLLIGVLIGMVIFLPNRNKGGL